MLISQAIFTSAQTGGSSGYRLVADSGDVDPADRRALTVWGPSHDSLWGESQGAASVNFHPLPSGAYCISRTVAADAEYSGRGGKRIYTQCLVVPADTLLLFGNNPFAVLTAVRAQGAVQVHESIPERLNPILLAGRASVVDCQLLETLHEQQDFAWLAAAVQFAMSSDTVALVGSARPDDVFAAMLNCLPPSWRTSYSLTTGLKHSLRRPFRWFTLPSEQTVQRQVLRRTNAALFDVSHPPAMDAPAKQGWPRFVDTMVKTGRVSELAEFIAQIEGDVTVPRLHRRGQQLLASSAVGDDHSLSETSDGSHSDSATSTQSANHSDAIGDRAESASSRHSELADPMSSLATELSVPAAVAPREDLLSASEREHEVAHTPFPWLGVADGAMLDVLERLDDAVFDAITGRDCSLRDVAALWREARQQVGRHLLEESREKYVQHVLRYGAGEDVSENDSDSRDPAEAIRALEIISLFF